MRKGKQLGFVGGIDSYAFEKIIDVWHLSNQSVSEVRDVFLREFATFDDLATYAENANDFEVKRIVEIVSTYGSAVEGIVHEIRAATVVDLAKADVVLTTAHKCKGLSLHSVVLADDFADLIDASGTILPPEKLNRQEVNLLYVAITRASHRLELNGTTRAFLKTLDIAFDRAPSIAMVDITPQSITVDPVLPQQPEKPSRVQMPPPEKPQVPAQKQLDFFA